MASRSRLMGGSTLYFYMWQCCLCSLPPQSKGWNGKTQIGEAERKRGWETMDIVNGIPRFRAPSGLCHPWVSSPFHAYLRHCLLEQALVGTCSRCFPSPSSSSSHQHHVLLHTRTVSFLPRTNRNHITCTQTIPVLLYAILHRLPWHSRNDAHELPLPSYCVQAAALELRRNRRRKQERKHKHKRTCPSSVQPSFRAVPSQPSPSPQIIPRLHWPKPFQKVKEIQGDETTSKALAAGRTSEHSSCFEYCTVCALTFHGCSNLHQGITLRSLLNIAHLQSILPEHYQQPLVSPSLLHLHEKGRCEEGDTWRELRSYSYASASEGMCEHASVE
mmetsp:Transcript_21392/g.59482  ORF Transcript_21392/g.59482 Transcript_21392/m.59482 type:complete len:331 (-) Transcript_21392:1500-2492(-)